MIPDPKIWTRSEIERHSLDMRQFIDFRQSTLPNGIRIIEAYNSSGLTFTLLPDRGMDIWTAQYKGIPLTWVAPGSPHPPDLGQTWLQQFNGGLLTTCGLTHVGPPEHDEISSEWRDIHGRYSRLRTEQVSIEHQGWINSDSESYLITLNTSVSESSLFGTQLRLKRTINLWLGKPSITINDTITNLSDTPSPLMVLYHFNIGYPLVNGGSRLFTPHKAVYPRDPAAQKGFDQWSEYGSGEAGYAEQVFFHHLFENHQQQTTILFCQEGLGLGLDWATASLPYFTQWKNTRQGIYVSGIEPGNCIPEGQNAARHNGRLKLLAPRESVSMACKLTLFEGNETLTKQKQLIGIMKETGTPIQGCLLDDFTH